MSSKRKSHRSKKNVNYADNNLNYESDDEFEPPSKKVKTKIIPIEDVVKKEKNGTKSPTRRLSVDEKLYQRDVEKALKISLSDSSNNEKGDDVVEINKTKKLTTLEDSDYEPEDETTGYESDEEKENDSDFSDVEIRKKTVTKGKKTNNSRSIGNNKNSVSSSKKLTSVVPAREKQISLLSETSADQTKAILAILPGKRTSSSSGGIRTTTLVNRNLSSLGLGGVIIKNPGPPIRVGLSRNMKVKPLHSRVSGPH